MAVTINIPSQVKTYANLAAFPASGSLKTIYIAEDTNKTYRWTGSVYVEISASAAMTWGQIGGTLSNQTDLQTALNAKQDVLGFTPVPTSRTLTINGVTQDLSADRTFTIATGLTVGTTPISSGTIGRVLFQGTGNVLQQSSSLFWDSTNNRLGIGTSTPAFPLDVTYNDNSYNLGLSVRNTNTGTNALTGYSIYNSSNVKTASFVFAPSNFAVASLANTVIFSSEGSQKLGFIANSGNGGTAQDIYFSTSGGNSTYQMQIKGNTGNVQIGTNTDAGFRLDVNGTARVQGTTTISKSSSNNYFTFEPSATGTAPFLQAFFQGQTDHRMYFNSGSVAFRNAGTVLKSNIDCGNITAEGTAYLTGAADQSIWLGGSTNNYLRFTDAGVIHIGLIGTADATSYIQVRTGGATNMSTGTLSTAFFSTGNVGINTTTDAGFRLDVNGTARVSGVFSVGSDTARIDLWRSSGAFGGRIGTGYTNPSVNHVYIQCDTNSKAILIDDSNRTLFSSSNGDTTTASAQVTINSSTRGFLPPRMTTTQRNAIASPAAGLIVYDTTLNLPHFFNGTIWVSL